MERHLLIVLAKPVTPEQEQQFNEWYSTSHIDEMLHVDGFVAAQRFKVADADPSQECRWPYLAVYEVEGDVDQARRAHREAMRRAGRSAETDLLHEDRFVCYFTPIADRETRGSQ